MELESVKRSIIAEEMLLNEIEKVMKESGKIRFLLPLTAGVRQERQLWQENWQKDVSSLCK